MAIRTWNRVSISYTCFAAVAVAVGAAACSAAGEPDNGGSSGGSPATTSGGSTSAPTQGGSTASGGALVGSGGSVATSSGGSIAGGGAASSSSTGGAATSGGFSQGGSTQGGAASGGGMAQGGNGAAGSSAGGGSTGTAGSAGSGGAGSGAGAGGGGAGAPSNLGKFSFFVTSQKAIVQLAGNSNGFGGDLRFGETGADAGLRGADKICATIAETTMPGATQKQWRAFLSAADGGNGSPVNAIDRIGEGPWYDRLGRLIAMTKADLLNTRPKGADTAIINDLPNEEGTPNGKPDGATQVDNHDTLTGSNEMGQLFSATATCKNWTSVAKTGDGKPRVGHSWPRSAVPIGGGTIGGGFPGGGFPAGGGGGIGFPGGGINQDHWISALDEAGCAPGINIVEMGPPGNDGTIGSGGGYGGFYCFALTP